MKLGERDDNPPGPSPAHHPAPDGTGKSGGDGTSDRPGLPQPALAPADLARWLERVRSERRLRRRSEQLHAIAQTTLAMSAAPTLDTKLQVLVDGAADAVGAHLGAIRVYEDGDDALGQMHICLSDKYARWRDYRAHSPAGGLLDAVRRDNRPIRLTQAELLAHPDWTGFGTQADRHPPLRGWLAVPLLASDGGNLGVLQLSDKREGEFDAEDEAILVQLAQFASVAVEAEQGLRALHESEARYRNLVNHAITGVVQCDLQGGLTFANRHFCEMSGYSERELLERSIFDLTDEASRALTRAALDRVLAGTPDCVIEKRYRRKDGSTFWGSASINALRGPGGDVTGLGAVIVDISERKRAETLQTGLSAVLERIARGAPLAESLDALALLVEQLSEHGLIASMLLLDREGRHLHHAAGPTLPEPYRRAIDGLEIGPEAGSCGTAVYRRAPVEVTDIASDPLWKDYRELALAHGLRACWSNPVLSAAGEVLGTFALYYREPRPPARGDHELVAFALRTAAVAIERQRDETALRESEEQFRRALLDAPTPVLMHAADGEVLQISRAWSALTGYAMDDAEALEAWLADPEGGGGIGEAMRRLYERGRDHEHEQHLDTADTDVEIATRRGERRTWTLSASSPGLLRDGRRFVVAMALDVTERKRAENRDRFLIRLDDAMRPLSEPARITETAALMLGRHLHADRVAYAEVGADQDSCVVLGEYPRLQGSVLGRYRLSDFSVPMRDALRRGEISVVDDVAAVASADAHAFEAVGVRAAVTVPLRKGEALIATVSVHQTRPRVWQPHEINLIEVVTRRCWGWAERARVRRDLVDSDARYRTLFGSIDQGFCIVQILLGADGAPSDYRFIETNPAFVEQTGLREAVGRTMRELVPEVSQWWIDTYGDVALTGRPARFENHLDAMDRWFDVYACRIDAPAQRKVAILFKDITRRKQAELNTALLAEVSADLALLSDRESIMRAVGARVCGFLGLTRLSFVEVDIDDRRCRSFNIDAGSAALSESRPELSQFIDDAFEQVLREGRVLSIEDVESDPRTRAFVPAYRELGVRSFLTLPYYSDQRWKYLLVSQYDRSHVWTRAETELLRELSARVHLRLERAAAEAAMRESERRFSAIFEQAAAGICYSGPDGRFSMVNERFCRITGRSREELLGMRMQDLTHPEDLPANLVLYRQMKEEGRSFRVDKRYVTPTGKIVWVSNEVSAVRDDHGQVIATMAVVQDITERKRGEDRDRLLVAIDDAVLPLDDPEQIATAAVRVLGEHLRLDRAAWYEVEADEDTAVVVGDYSPGLPSVVGRYRLSEFGDVVHASLRAGREFWEDDIEHEGRMPEERARLAALQIRAYLTVPLRRGGALVAGLACYQAGPRAWSDEDIELARLVAARCWESIERARVARRLAENEERLRVALDTGRLGSWQLDLASMALTCNAQFKGSFGLEADAAVDYRRLVDDLVHPDDRATVRHAVSEAIEQRREYDIEYRTVWPDGSLHWIVARGRAFYDVTGQPVRIAGVTLDMTERKFAEEALRVSEERASLALEVAKLGTWSWEPANDLVRADARCREMCGLDPGAPLSLASIAARIHPEDRARIQAALQAALRPDGDGRHAEEFRWQHADGSVRWTVSRGQTLFDGAGPDRRPVLMLGSIIDMTERKHTEEALLEADRRKDEFLATLAHELRNPLAPIRNCLHILRMKGDPEPDVSRLHEMMERQVRHLVRLVDDLMEASRITRGNIELRREALDLADVVRNAVETSRPLIEAGQHGIEVQLPDEPLPLHADPVRMSQVFANLLNNAAKYSEPGGRIVLGARREGELAVVSVRDRGLGIAPEMLPRVFDMFAQIDQARGYAQGGLGIGLSLVRSLVALHGGTVEARSEGLGCGSEFLVRLPLRPAPDAHEGGEGPSSAGGPGDAHRIVVIDDNHESADSLGLFLRLSGHDVRVFYDGAAGLAAAGAFHPDTVLLDIGMPELDGYEVCRRLRTSPEGAELVVIAVTGWGQNEDRRRSELCGFDAHVVKPVDPPALLALMDSLWLMKQKQRAEP